MVINITGQALGMITPPVGLNLFVTSGITGMSMIEVIKATYPWLLLLLSFLMIITYIPELSIFLPNLLMGPETVNM